MYLTTKNAGINIYNIAVCASLTELDGGPLHFIMFTSLSSLFLPARIRPSRAPDLWRGCQGPALQKEDAGADWRAGSRPSQSEEQAAGVGSAAVRHHHPLWVQPFIITLNHRENPSIIQDHAAFVFFWLLLQYLLPLLHTVTCCNAVMLCHSFPLLMSFFVSVVSSVSLLKLKLIFNHFRYL